MDKNVELQSEVEQALEDLKKEFEILLFHEQRRALEFVAYSEAKREAELLDEEKLQKYATALETKLDAMHQTDLPPEMAFEEDYTE